MWAIARAKPGMMATALVNLQRQTFNHYAPMIEETRIRRGVIVTEPKYLFSTYIFVEVLDRWMALSNTYGLSRVICFDNKPASVSQKIIDDLKSREENGFYRPIEPQELFHKDQRIYINNGLLQGKFGICQGMKGSDRVKILLIGLAGNVRATLPAVHLEAA
jgi:transcriptional antiterminator RfaH